MNPHSSSLRRITREDCNPGDWIEASLVPEWKGTAGRHTFTPSGISISPELGRLGGVLAEAGGDAWEFESRTDGAEPYWVRLS
jgi:hypothetical protein